MITFARDGIARLWNIADGKLVREYPVNGTFSGTTQFSPDGTKFAVSAEEGLSVWDVASGEQVATAEGGRAAVFSPDGRQLYVGHGNRVDVVDATSGAVARSMELPSRSVRLFPDGLRLMTGGGLDGLISDAQTGAILHKLSGHTGPIQEVAVSPDGRYVATSSIDKTAKVWDADTGRLVQTMTGHTEILFRMAFSPDNRSLMTGSLDNTARLWDIATGNEIRRFTGHTAAVYVVDFTPDGHYAITGSADKSARIWDRRARSRPTRWQARSRSSTPSTSLRTAAGSSRAAPMAPAACGTRRHGKWSPSSTRIVAWTTLTSRPMVDISWSPTRIGRPNCGMSPAPPSSACWMARRGASRLISRPTGD